MKTSRRGFLKASAGLSVPFFLPEVRGASGETGFEPNAYIRIAPDNQVTLWMTRSEMGQGARTMLAALLAEELEVDLTRVRLEQAVPGPKFKNIRLRTSGSGSSSATYLPLRRAGAAAREMLISAAAKTWHVESGECEARMGLILHPPSNRRVTYGELAEAASVLPVPASPVLKSHEKFRLIGKPVPRVDAPDIVRGKAVYGLDVRVPGMLVAVIERCPWPGGSLRSFDASGAMAVAGVQRVFAVRSGIFGGGVAVVAGSTWAALKGKAALKVDWDAGPNGRFNSPDFENLLKNSASGRTTATIYPIRREGDTDLAAPLKNPPATGSRVLEAVYEYPFQAHAPVEPMNCIAHVSDNGCEIWAPSQTPETARQNAAKFLGISPDAVVVHTTLCGGGFGRRLFVDYVDEAVEISQAMRKPVQVVWTRQDDMRNGFFHPASAESMQAEVSREGALLRWQHVSAGSDLSMFGLPTAEEKKDPEHYAKDESPWGAFDTPYNFPALKIDYVPVDSPIPSGSWRAVEYPSRVFARESFLDEVAHELHKDPLEFRIELLRPGNVLKLGSQNIDRSRMIGVLEETRRRSDWVRPLPASAAGRLRGRGLAINIYHAGSYMAQVAEVSLAADLTDLRVDRIVCVFDCGLAINPQAVEAQVESAVTWGLSAALHGRIEFREGRVRQSGFHDFRVMRLPEMPPVESYRIDSLAAPGGFGEHGVPQVAPALANAIFSACGKRLRKLPFDLSEAEPEK